MDPRCTRRVHLHANNNTTAQRQDDADVDAVLLRSIEEITLKISSACQKLSIHGVWDNTSPRAILSSMERVEMEVTVYLGEAATTATTPRVLLVELQRLKGDAVTFHNYRRLLLDAAEGKVGHDGSSQTMLRNQPPRASLVRPSLSRPSSIGRQSSIGRPCPMGGTARQVSIARPSPLGAMKRPSRIMSRPLPTGEMARPRPSPLGKMMSRPGSIADPAPTPAYGSSFNKQEANPGDTLERALEALNTAAALIKKDRLDARRLGLESLALLTDPLRAGRETAEIASRVVLLGTARSEMDVIDKSSGTAASSWLAPSLSCDATDAPFDDSVAELGIRETVLETIMKNSEEEEETMSATERSLDGCERIEIEKEFTDGLFSLCLTVLANTLHTLKGSSVTDVSSRRFVDDSISDFGCDVLSCLLRILDRADANPHDACTSARCLAVLFGGCGDAHRARALGDLDARRTVAEALEAGRRSHAKLADASGAALRALVGDDEASRRADDLNSFKDFGGHLAFDGLAH